MLIGRKSFIDVILGFFGIGFIRETFHKSGNVEDVIDRFTNLDMKDNVSGKVSVIICNVI